MKPIEVFLVVDIKTIPDIDTIDNMAKKENVLPTDIALRYGKYLPAPLQQIVAMGTLFVMYPQDLAEPPVLSWRGYAGANEKEILRTFWNALSYPDAWVKKLSGERATPRVTLITFDGKRAGIPTIISRSVLAQRHNFLEYGALDPIVLKGTKKILDKSDKWENANPNYMNRYSKYNIDLKESLSFGGYSPYRSIEMESLWTFLLQTAPDDQYKPLSPEQVINLIENKDYRGLARAIGESVRNLWNIFVELSISEGRPLTRESIMVSNSAKLKTQVTGDDKDIEKIETVKEIERALASLRGEYVSETAGTEKDVDKIFAHSIGD